MSENVVKQMNKTESREDYLETILIIMKKKGSVRSIDIANELNYSKPSISRAVHILEEHGYIVIGSGGHISFTEKGLALAEDVYSRHTAIKKFFMDVLGVSEENAERDACKVEHILSDETFEKLKGYKG